MNSFEEIVSKVLTFALLPATVYGAGGAFIQARRNKRPARQTLLEVIGGVITANMLSPLVQDATPEKLHFTLFFLVGWGGLELVSRLYEVAVSALERRIAQKLSGEQRTSEGNDKP